MEAIGKAYAESLDPVIGFLNDLPAIGESTEAGVSEAWLQMIRTRLRLTESQWQYLKKWLTGHAARGDPIQPVLDVLPESFPTTKQENNRYFERLKDALKG